MIGDVAVPVVQRSSTDSDPHERADDIHDCVAQLPEMTIKEAFVRNRSHHSRRAIVLY